MVLGSLSVKIILVCFNLIFEILKNMIFLFDFGDFWRFLETFGGFWMLLIFLELAFFGTFLLLF